jgi:DUF1680 family protein
MWNHRMHTMTRESKYMDIAERTLLNNMLSSLSQEGDKHYYTNPLMTDGRQRWEWPGHDCACCPSNLSTGYRFDRGLCLYCSDDTLHVNMYMPSEADISDGRQFCASDTGDALSWQGDIKADHKPKNVRNLLIELRIPGWVSNRPLPGNLYQYSTKTRGNNDEGERTTCLKPLPEKAYVTLSRKWEFGDTVNLICRCRFAGDHPSECDDEQRDGRDCNADRFVYCASSG